MDCILHIGTEKTGTTALQEFFARNRSQMAQHGVLYPVSPGAANHMAMALYGSDFDSASDLPMMHDVDSAESLDRFRVSLEQRLISEKEASGAAVCVFSGEHCSSRLLQPHEVDRLRDALLRIFDRVRVVVYLRRQDDFYFALYSTAVKCGAMQPISLPSAQESRDLLDYHALLARWYNSFGRENLIIRKFDVDVISDFLECTGLSRLAGLPRPGRVNTSLGVKAMEFLLQINKFLPRVQDGKLNRLRGDIAEVLERVTDGSRTVWDAAISSAIMDQVKVSNSQLRSRFSVCSLKVKAIRCSALENRAIPSRVMR